MADNEVEWARDVAALALDEGMAPEEAAAYAVGQALEMRSRARARRPPGGSGGKEGMGEALGTSNPPIPTGGVRGLTDLLQRASERGESKMVVDGMIAEGLTVFAGASKIGKSFVCVDVAFGVAAGRPVLGHLVSEPGDVLYLALEDTSTRLVQRMEWLEPDRGEWPMERLTVVSMDMLAGIKPGQLAVEWADTSESPRLIIIDTITRFGGQGDRSGYKADVEWMARFHKLAVDKNVALLAVTHTNQMKVEEGDDWFNRISGTTGIVGTADNAMLLDVKRGEIEGVLRIEGRDMDPTELALRKVGPWWQVTSLLRGQRGDLSVAIGDFVITSGETTTAAVATQFDISVDKASQYLGRLRKAGVISQPRRGMWSGTVAPV